jgi:hypothetical protein
MYFSRVSIQWEDERNRIVQGYMPFGDPGGRLFSAREDAECTVSVGSDVGSCQLTQFHEFDLKDLIY